MKIKIKELGIDLNTDEYTDKQLYDLHTYYYQQDLRDVAQKFTDEIENRKRKADKVDEDI